MKGAPRLSRRHDTSVVRQKPKLHIFINECKSEKKQLNVYVSKDESVPFGRVEGSAQ